MAYPIKYIENNLVFNHDGECFAYYELLPYNYSFLSSEQKYQVHDSFRQLIAQNRDGKIHALQISTESSIRAAQERSKQEVTGKLKDVACAKIDAQTEALISMIGENQVDYRFFIGFKLLVNEQEVTMKQFGREAKTAVSDFLHEVNHKLMGDFVSMSNEEIWRFQKMEKLLENKISRRFKVRRLDKDDFGYLIEHLYGQTGTAYEDYEYYLPKKRFQEETLVKYYDLIKPKLSYVVRVTAPDLEELKRRCNEVKDFYDDLNVKLVRPFGDMLGLHGEFLPASKRYLNDYIQYVTSDFLAGLGFGATQMLGEPEVSYEGAVAERASVPVVKSASIHREQIPPVRTERQIAPPAPPDKPDERQKTAPTITPAAPRPSRPIQNDTAPVIPERKRAAPVVKESNFTIRRTTARKEWTKTEKAAAKQKKGEKP